MCVTDARNAVKSLNLREMSAKLVKRGTKWYWRDNPMDDIKLALLGDREAAKL